MSDVEELQRKVRSFAESRAWETFHTPKNLSMALAGEAGELLAEFQWLTANESALDNLSTSQKNAIEMEIADVMIYLVRLCDVLHVDLVRATETKLAINEDRFPLLP